MDGFLVAAVDFGSEKLSVSLGKEEDSNFNIIDSLSGTSRGIEKGFIKDKVKCIEDLKMVMKDLSGVAKNETIDVYAGISARGLRSVEILTSVNSKYGLIRSEDIKRAIERGKRNVVLDKEEDIVDIVINNYILDGKVVCENPIGSAGSTLSLNITVIVGPMDELCLFKEVVTEAGYRFAGFLVNIIAGKQVFVQGKSAVGIRALVDIGGGTSDLAVYEDGTLKYIYSIPVGGNNITKDLSICGEFSISEAEEFKKAYSNKYFTLNNDIMRDDEIDFNSIKVSKTLFYEVTSARIEEILRYVNLDLKNTSFFDGICSIIIYGDGISYYEYIDDMIRDSIEKRTKIITKEKLGIEDSENITSLALVKEVYDRFKLINDNLLNNNEEIKIKEDNENEQIKKEQRGIIKKFKSFLEDIF